jgi:hypothetical protein
VSDFVPAVYLRGAIGVAQSAIRVGWGAVVDRRCAIRAPQVAIDGWCAVERVGRVRLRWNPDLEGEIRGTRVLAFVLGSSYALWL